MDWMMMLAICDLLIYILFYCVRFTNAEFAHQLALLFTQTIIVVIIIIIIIIIY